MSKFHPGKTGRLCIAAVFLLGGCDKISQSIYLRGFERDILKATRVIANAESDVQRAAGYAERGRAYSEKARYSRAFKLIPADEYERLFNLAIHDHDRAIALDPRSAEVYFSRGKTYYDRVIAVPGEMDKAWLDPAVSDFTKAVELDGRHALAWDRLGLVHEATGEMDKAIEAYTREAALDPAGRMRLADAYCSRGSVRQREKNAEGAIADFEKAIEIGVTADGCSCEPYNPLVGLYAGERGQYDKAREVVSKAKATRKWIAPELLEKLKKDSGRSD